MTLREMRDDMREHYEGSEHGDIEYGDMARACADWRAATDAMKSALADMRREMREAVAEDDLLTAEPVHEWIKKLTEILDDDDDE